MRSSFILATCERTLKISPIFFFSSFFFSMNLITSSYLKISFTSTRWINCVVVIEVIYVRNSTIVKVTISRPLTHVIRYHRINEWFSCVTTCSSVTTTLTIFARYDLFTQKISESGSFEGAACSASCMLDSVLRRFILPLLFFSIVA